jgi:hypothetical protein
MREIVKINLENEMDLILANRRTMKLAELCGLSLTVQTALATAVSEIARCALSKSKSTFLHLGILTLSPLKKQVSVVVCNTAESCANREAISYAKRLIDDVQAVKSNSFYDVHLRHDLKFPGFITESKIDSFIEYFKNEPALSPYDEIRRQNVKLLEFSDKLKESENQYRELAETLPLMMFSINPPGETIYTNKWLKNYFGFASKAKPVFTWQEFVHPDDYAAIRKDWDAQFHAKSPFHSQARLKRNADAVFLWHLISIVPVRNESNMLTHWTGFFVDINAQKLVEETLNDNVELKEAHKKLVGYQNQLEDKVSELNISNHELEQFAYIASHDLQEPLRKIITFSHLLGDKLKDLDEDSRKYFNKIVSSSSRMTELINDVLDWSRIAKTQQELSPVNLNSIVEDVKSDFELLIEEKGAVVERSKLPMIKGNPIQMIQLFTNLLSNSLKFCNKSPIIKIASRYLPFDEVEMNTRLDVTLRYAEITLSDNGIGFEQKYSDQIFKIFQRLNGRSEYAGTGIGLAICKRIVENHRGVISAQGKVGEGCAFTIILPVSHLGSDKVISDKRI